jgi:hypothetical protein
LSRFSVSAVVIPITGVFRCDRVTVPATHKEVVKTLAVRSSPCTWPNSAIPEPLRPFVTGQDLRDPSPADPRMWRHRAGSHPCSWSSPLLRRPDPTTPQAGKERRHPPVARRPARGAAPRRGLGRGRLRALCPQEPATRPATSSSG